jgi:hypothetical protein
VGAGFALVDNIRGTEYQTRALVMALGTGDPRRIARALATEVGFLAAQGVGRARIDRVIARAEELNREPHDPYVDAMITMCKGGVAYFVDNAWRAAFDLAREAEAGFRQLSAGGWEIDTMHLMQSWGLLKLGDLAEMERLVPSWIREAERRGDLYAAVSLRTRCNLAWLVSDDVARAEADLEDAIAVWMPPEQSYQVQHLYGLYGRVDLELYRGAPARAAEHVAAASVRLRRSLLLRLPILRLETQHDLGRIALALGALPGADARNQAAQARVHARRMAREKLPLAQGCSALIAAGAAHLDGNRDLERRELERALGLLEANGTLLFATAARHRLGALVGGDEGRALVAAAEDWYRKQGVKNPERMTALNAPGW